MDQDATAILRFLVERDRDSLDRKVMEEITGRSEVKDVSGQDIQAATSLSPQRINDAVALLEMSDYVETLKHMGTAPYEFGLVEANARGRYEIQRIDDLEASENAEEGRASPGRGGGTVQRSRIPQGSPYGFQEQDWEYVDAERSQPHLKVVFGLQWDSDNHVREKLQANLRADFENAIQTYNEEPGHEPARLDFVVLQGGYGEHLFNEIAREIISADIAVFDTSDLNPNVMIEMGVALTWGVRVHPVRADGTKVPPSDISGQTWACYLDDGASWVTDDHEDKLLRMVRRAMQKKTGSG